MLKPIVNNHSGGRALSSILWELSQDTQRERIAIGDLLVALGDRATGALMFIFAFPNVLPKPPGQFVTAADGTSRRFSVVGARGLAGSADSFR